jgi:cell division topological specificity factor
MDFLQKLLGHKQPASGQLAKERLKLVLVHDRVKMSPQMLQTLKDELIAVISKHLDVDQAGVQITIGDGNRLVADIPLMPHGGRRSRPSARE